MAIRKKAVASSGDRKILLMDSISYADQGDTGVFAISASHGGKSSAHIASKLPLLGAVFNDAGVGKDEAGIAGLALLDEKDMPALTVSHMSAHIGDVEDVWANGVISHLNGSASRAGFKIGDKIQSAILGWLGQNGAALKRTDKDF